jgi:hypothetical protein
MPRITCYFIVGKLDFFEAARVNDTLGHIQA